MTDVTETNLKQWLCGKLQTLMRLEEAPSPDSNTLADLGMNSLAAVALQYSLQTEFSLEASLETLMGGGTITSLARTLAANCSNEPAEEMPT